MEEKYYHTKASVEEYINLAKDVNGSQLIEQLKLHLKLNSKVLEIGSGPGSDWQILNKLYTTTGSDNSKEFLKHLRLKNPKGEFLELDATSLDTKQKFDAIYSNKVLHHLSDEALTQSILQQCKILNHGGIICHSFWKGSGSEVFKGMFVNYHDKNELESFFGNTFKILLLESYQEFESDDSLLLIGKVK